MLQKKRFGDVIALRRALDYLTITIQMNNNG